jgi:ParB-like chromosome segregation protein Spo0J
MTAAAPKSRITKDGRSITVHIPVTFRQRAGRKQILTPSGSAPWSPAPRVDGALLKAIVRAHRWREMIERGEYESAAELAKAEKVNDSYLSRILRLTLLAPEIVEAIVAGHQPPTLQVDDLLRPLPARWQQQKLRLYGR